MWRDGRLQCKVGFALRLKRMCSFETKQSCSDASEAVCLLYSDTVLYEPFVYRLCWMGHEDTASEVGLGQDEWQGHSMVEMETSMEKVVSTCRSWIFKLGA